MEFHQKLQELRKQKGLTQEELAQALYVSRTAISKWESGRGCPSIDSLKAIAQYFCVSIDALLSGEEVLTVAEEDRKQQRSLFQGLVFGLLDFSVALFFFLPLFGQRTQAQVFAVPLWALTDIGLYLKIAYWITVSAITGWGVATLALRHEAEVFRNPIPSLLLSSIGALLFMVSLQPYAAAFVFVLLAIKVLILLKKQ